MIQRFHGIDRHKNFATISVLSREGHEISFIPCCTDFKGYIRGLGAEYELLQKHIVSYKNYIQAVLTENG